MVTVVIYTITNPINNQIFYVGRAIGKLKSRLAQHINERLKYKTKKNDVLIDILAKNKYPVIEEIDSIVCKNDKEERIANLLEVYWINQLKQWGFDMCNKCGLSSQYSYTLLIDWDKRDIGLQKIIEVKTRVGREIVWLSWETLPEARNTPLGRKSWNFEQNKRRKQLEDKWDELDWQEKKYREKRVA